MIVNFVVEQKKPDKRGILDTTPLSMHCQVIIKKLSSMVDEIKVDIIMKS